MRIPDGGNRNANLECILLKRNCCVTPGKEKIKPTKNTAKTEKNRTELKICIEVMCRQLLRWRLPLPTYHGANGGWKSRGIEGGCTSAGAVTAEVPPLRLRLLLLLLLLRRGVRCAMCRCCCHRRRPNASNGNRVRDAPNTNAEVRACALRNIYRAPYPSAATAAASLRAALRGPGLAGWPHPRRARPPAALCAPATAGAGPGPEREAFGERGEGLRGRPYLGLGRGQSVCTAPTWAALGSRSCPPLTPVPPHL